MSPPLHNLEFRLAASWPPDDWKDVTVLVAVSGGSDSVALLRGLAAVRRPGDGRLIIAHVNHKLRGADSEADLAFVRHLSESLGVPCEAVEGPVESAASKGLGLEDAARRVRYALLEAMAGRLGARFVVTAHTADDQAETILHRIVRGTGLRGLAGMRRARRLGPATLLRPLLGLRRAELSQYLNDLGQTFRTDASNRDCRFTRNRLRTELLPMLAAEYNGSVVEALTRLGELAAESQSIIEGMACDMAERCLCSAPDGEVRLDVALLAVQPPHLVREVLMHVWRHQGWPQMAMGFAEFDLLQQMIATPGASSPRRSFPGSITAEVGGGELRLRRSPE